MHVSNIHCGGPIMHYVIGIEVSKDTSQVAAAGAGKIRLGIYRSTAFIKAFQDFQIKRLCH